MTPLENRTLGMIQNKLERGYTTLLSAQQDIANACSDEAEPGMAKVVDCQATIDDVISWIRTMKGDPL